MERRRKRKVEEETEKREEDRSRRMRVGRVQPRVDDELSGFTT